MMLVRSATRERELAIRTAVGSSRRRLVQYLLMEALVLAVLGGVLAIAVLAGAQYAMSWWVAQPLPSLQVDLPMVVLCLLLALVTTLAFGLVPALRFSRPELLATLKEDIRGGGRRSGRVHRLTASLQTGIALPVLVVAVVLGEGARSIVSADFGFETSSLLVSPPIDLSAAGYSDDDLRIYVRSVVDDVESLPRVQSVAFSDGVPLDGVPRTKRVGRPGADATMGAHVTRAGAGFLETLRISLLRGRAFNADDGSGSEPVTVIAESLAELLFANEDPLGQQLTIDFGARGDGVAFDRPGQRDFTVVGVVRDVAGPNVDSPSPSVFVPYWQEPARSVTLVTRASSRDEGLVEAIRDVAYRADPDLGQPRVVAYDQLVEAATVDFGVFARLLAGLAAVLLLLSAAGIYGVVAFSVANRTREIGVRMSMGATRGQILRHVVVDGLKLALPGMVVGLALSVWIVDLVVAPIWVRIGVAAAADPRIYGAGALAAVLIAVLATVSPANRAAGVHPMEALRAE